MALSRDMSRPLNRADTFDEKMTGFDHRSIIKSKAVREPANATKGHRFLRASGYGKNVNDRLSDVSKKV